MKPYLISVVREVHLVEDLRRLVLDGLHLHQVRRELALAEAHGLLEPVETVERQLVAGRAQELGDLGKEGLTAGEDSRQQPHQLPATFIAQPGRWRKKW